MRISIYVCVSIMYIPVCPPQRVNQPEGAFSQPLRGPKKVPGGPLSSQLLSKKCKPVFARPELVSKGLRKAQMSLSPFSDKNEPVSDRPESHFKILSSLSDPSQPLKGPIQVIDQQMKEISLLYFTEHFPLLDLLDCPYLALTTQFMAGQGDR